MRISLQIITTILVLLLATPTGYAAAFYKLGDIKGESTDSAGSTTSTSRGEDMFIHVKGRNTSPSNTNTRPVYTRPTRKTRSAAARSTAINNLKQMPSHSRAAFYKLGDIKGESKDSQGTTATAGENMLIHVKGKNTSPNRSRILQLRAQRRAARSAAARSTSINNLKQMPSHSRAAFYKLGTIKGESKATSSDRHSLRELRRQKRMQQRDSTGSYDFDWYRVR